LVRDFYIFPCRRKGKNFRKIISSKFKFIFHGCKMFRWLQDYPSFQPCANSASLCMMLNNSVSPTGGEARLLEGCSSGRKQHCWSIKLPEFMFSHRKKTTFTSFNLVTLQENVTIFDFVRYTAMISYFLLVFSIMFWFWKKRKTILNTKTWGKCRHNVQNFNWAGNLNSQYLLYSIVNMVKNLENYQGIGVYLIPPWK
jgi:hypothetical protein